MPYQHKHKYQFSGFTLIEILFVCVVLSIVVALIAPAFSGPVESFRFRHAVGQVPLALRYARSRALMEQEDLCLSCDGEPLQCVLARKGSQESEQSQDPLWRNGIRFLSDVRLEKGDRSIDIDREGIIQAARSCFCLDQHCLTVDTQEILGQAMVYEGCYAD